MATLPGSVLDRYPRFSLYNSPYPAHDRGCAIDLYPDGNAGLSPVAGTVVDTRTVRAPPKPYAAECDHLILVDTGEYVARVLHVDPAVAPGDAVSVGDPLGEMVRSGFFAPWVDDHVHLGFRDPEGNPYRASGSLPLSIDVAVDPLPWDGTGTVVERGDTYAVLDAPRHPAPGERFVGIAADDGTTALDGGLVHYRGGGALAGADGPVGLLGTRVGTAGGRDVRWADVAIRANGVRIAGLSLFAARDAGFGAKLVCPDHRSNHRFAVGERVRVGIEPTDEPVRFDSG